MALIFALKISTWMCINSVTRKKETLFSNPSIPLQLGLSWLFALGPCLSAFSHESPWCHWVTAIFTYCSCHYHQMTLYLPSHAHGSAGLELGLFRKPIHLLVCTHSQCKYISMDHNYNNIYYRVEMLEGNFPRAIINLIFFGQSQIYVIFYFQFHGS